MSRRQYALRLQAAAASSMRRYLRSRLLKAQNTSLFLAVIFITGRSRFKVTRFVHPGTAWYVEGLVGSGSTVGTTMATACTTNVLNHCGENFVFGVSVTSMTHCVT